MVKIYTKTGDKGMTKLVGGMSVAKDSDRVESYGTVDELNSWVGYVVSILGAEHLALKEELHTLQQYLFDAGTDLATPIELERPMKLDPQATTWLEGRIDAYTAETPDLQRFILPGGSQGGAALHVARTISRRAERSVVRLNSMAKINPEIIMFVNRLSDYFYAVARAVNFRDGQEDIYYERGEKVFHNIKSDSL